jgi:para-aminobenzoate synthetase component 1
VPDVVSTFSRSAYLDAVERTREYIRSGDIYQANISHRMARPFVEHPFTLYASLARCNPAPFAAYFDIGPAVVVSASPERFVRLQGGHVETRPIKGTAPRGRSPDDDAALQAMLLKSEKDRAENVMIVDLLRNDLSKVCRWHTVRVAELCVLESYAGVHHLVSTVTGRLRPGLGPVDLLRAVFPGGSITGAPKIRAMEVIAELEPTRRNVYSGAIGYIGFDGTMDTNIAIRTFIVTRGTAFFPVGSGIVMDSDPSREYSETLAKAQALLAALSGCPADVQGASSAVVPLKARAPRRTT